MRNPYIYKIGCELEGGWRVRPKGLKYDGSVYADAEFIGEVSSPAFLWVESLIRWIRKFYPHEVNSSCGFHIHVSFRNDLFYSLLMDEDFYRYFLEKTRRWALKKEREGYNMALFWERWEGRNKYCKRYFDPEEQASLDEKDDARYAHLNFCYKLRGTLECRLFPMFEKVDLACEAVWLFYRIISYWLRDYEKKEKEEEYTIVLTEDNRVEVVVDKNEIIKTVKEVRVCA
jgi:hypothetical protein